jgi:hypothetical protein
MIIITGGKKYNICQQLLSMICANFNSILCFSQLYLQLI